MFLLVFSSSILSAQSGGLPYILFINDISDLFHGVTGVKLFADDVKLYSKVCTDTDSLQDGLNRMLKQTGQLF